MHLSHKMRHLPKFLVPLFLFNQFQQKQNECCGIVGYIGNQKKAWEVCINGINILQSRGYDSCGVVTIEDKKFKVSKFASTDRYGGDCIKRLEIEGANNHEDFVGIGHTRWATHGDKTDLNAHPHFDHKERVALVHNGIIENYQQLKDELKNQYQIVPKSYTDTEIVAIYIGVFLDQGESLIKSIEKCVDKLEGTYSFALISILEPESIFLFKNTGTMVIGVSQNIFEGKQQQQNEHTFQIVSSDTTVFQDYTQQYYNIKEKEIVQISINSQIEKQQYYTIQEDKINIQKPPGIDHYYMMELLEQPDSVAKSLNYGARLMGGKQLVKLGGLDQSEERLIQIENIIIAGCGTSFYAAMYLEMLLRKLNVFNYVEAKMASEITDIDLQNLNPQLSGFLSVSQSGETMDLLIPFRLAKTYNINRINVVNKVMSTLAREEKCGCFLNCGRELSVASTKAFVSQVVVLTLVGLWFAQKKNYKGTKAIRQQIISELKFLSTNIKQVLEKSIDFSKNIAEILKNEQHLFLLGEQMGEIIGMEGSLKIKELTYIHTQCININNVPNNFYNYSKANKSYAICIVLDDQKDEQGRRDLFVKKMNKLVQQVQLEVIVITDVQETKCLEFLKEMSKNRLLQIQKSGFLTALLAIMPLQRLAYDITILKGYDPDKPRNLAKELTTK